MQTKDGGDGENARCRSTRTRASHKQRIANEYLMKNKCANKSNNWKKLNEKETTSGSDVWEKLGCGAGRLEGGKRQKS